VTPGKNRLFRNAALVLLGTAGLLLLLRKPILGGVGNFLVVSDPLEKADAIAVLSGNGAVRGAKAAELYQQMWAPKILLTKEGFPYSELEWRRYGVQVPETDTATFELLKFLGVPGSKMEVLDGYNESTFQEAGRYLNYARSRGLKRLIIVTSNFHTRRSRMTFRRVFRGSGITVAIQAAPPAWDFEPSGWWTRRLDVKNLLLEYQKLIFYYLRYW
jgi:uncharacterized SAM-binding protein YcdF (DUF218 family)